MRWPLYRGPAHLHFSNHVNSDISTPGLRGVLYRNRTMKGHRSRKCNIASTWDLASLGASNIFSPTEPAAKQFHIMDWSHMHCNFSVVHCSGKKKLHWLRTVSQFMQEGHAYSDHPCCKESFLFLCSSGKKKLNCSCKTIHAWSGIFTVIINASRGGKLELNVCFVAESE